MHAGLVDGVALAVSLAEPGRADDAEAALAPALAAAVTAQLAELAALSREARAAVLARLSLRVRGAVDPRAELTPRALALLAADVPREVGTAWLAAAPPVRRGYRADEALRHTLRALAVAPRREDAELARRETGHGRAVLAASRAALGPDRFARMLDALGAEEAAATLALAGLPSEPTDLFPLATGGGGSDRRLLVALAGEAMELAGAGERSRALGALALGAAGDLDGDARSQRWRETGLEIARVVVLDAEAP